MVADDARVGGSRRVTYIFEQFGYLLLSLPLCQQLRRTQTSLWSLASTIRPRTM